MYYVGLDVHTKQSTFCVRDENGKELRTHTVLGSWDQVIVELKKLDQPFAVCYEASTGYGVLHDRLRSIASRVVVAHPGQLRLIYKNKRKNDKIDAKHLSKMLILDAIPSVHVPSIQVRSWRAMIEHRQRLVQRLVQVKNQMRAFLRGFGFASPYRLWTKKGLQWIQELKLEVEFDRFRRSQLLEELAHTQQQIKRAETQLNAIGDRHPGVTLLKTTPGIGPRTAEAFVAYLDDPHRFQNARKAGCYFGLVPCQDASADKNRLGHITRQGPALVRKLLTEAAWQAIRRSPSVKAKYERLIGSDPDRRKIATVAIAHYLARVMWSMLKQNRPWEENHSKAA